MNKISRRKFVGGMASIGLLTGSFRLEDYFAGSNINGDVTVIGHRGFSGLEKDNSMAGFKRAHEVGVDGVELDVRMTRDNRIVLNHDPFLVGYEDLGLISNMDYSKAKDVEDRLVLLDDFLDWFETTDLDMYIDFKKADTIDPTIQKIRGRELSDRSVLLSLSTSHFELFPSDMKNALAGSITSRLLLDKISDVNPDYVIPHYTPFAEIEDKDVNSQINGYWMFSEKQEDVLNVLEENPTVVITNRPDIMINMIERTSNR